MDKRLIFPKNSGDRRDVYFVTEDRQYLRKHASSYHPKIASYIEKAKPMPDLVQILLTALGAYEFWGQNVNGDRFREKALSHEGDDYGYQTFASNANYFTHHVNKDPSLAKGKILHAVWNNEGKRVELIVGVSPTLDPEGAAMIDRGEDVTFSMGAKVPFDICSICMHKAKTRAEYCEHLRYLMNQIDPISNQLVGADNTIPKFFDLSRVLIPADKTAHIWTKVASASNPYRMMGSAELAELPPGKLSDTDYLLRKVAAQQELGKEKRASVNKRGSITKRFEVKASPEFTSKLDHTVPVSKALLQETAPAIPEKAFEDMAHAHVSLQQLLSTMAVLGMEPTREESAQILKAFDAKPSDLEKMKLGPDHFHEGASHGILPFVPHRSFSRPVLTKRITKLAQLLDEGDPATMKKAEAIRDIMYKDQHQDRAIHPAFIAGLAAALYALFGPHATGLSGGIGKVIANYPYLIAPLAAAAIAGGKVLSMPSRTGFYSVDDPNADLYNKNWQSRFADLQARPVTVIKTGAAIADSDLAKKLFYGVPAIYLGSGITKAAEDSHPNKQPGTVSQFIAENPDILSAGLIGEHLAGTPISQRVGAAIESGKRIIKSASIRDPEFLEAIPESEQDLIWDLAILDAADRIYKKVLGG